jgi:phosphohistidine phosphatase
MSIELILVRHAVAFERDRERWPDDRKRPLTPAGKEKFRRVARGLAKWLDKPTRLITSPLVRARETAALLTASARWPKPSERPELAPEVEPSKVLSMLRTQRAKRIALVGHEPALSALASYCIAGAGTTVAIEMKKGGVARIVFEGDIRPGKGTLIALLPPRALRCMS